MIGDRSALASAVSRSILNSTSLLDLAAQLSLLPPLPCTHLRCSLAGEIKPKFVFYTHTTTKASIARATVAMVLGRPVLFFDGLDRREKHDLRTG